MRNEKDNLNMVVEIFKALSEKNRVRVIAALTRNYELCVCQITLMLGLAYSTVSRHLNILLKAGLIRVRKDGKWAYYSLSDKFPGEILQWVIRNLEESEQIKRDANRLKKILMQDAEDLCSEIIKKVKS